MDELSTTMSSKGQVVIPAELRRKLGIEPGTKFAVYPDDEGHVVFAKVPTVSDWEKILANVLNENVPLDEKGHYDSKQSPDFDKWMKEG
ncbi:AbrB/MazE/SpoVT family DNA-binding domain-containing protein [Agrilactobacillus fermenti]|uniref:AbrB/MazE/SpoVT family DNA-binding domain-containing protein n=1 Tax=Agrilactobacillus fermenti TaxID=2586909 RepID=UPI001E539043|nr:AbrB/MazE/SpoVT family DNA-binding domain-containing protein [Agrilactobacillus fermenti]MCD2255179.1 AbrB/MazE/SpoVT family DNA-binding domain-containing protein [Agrilactobacillus fermenti]